MNATEFPLDKTKHFMAGVFICIIVVLFSPTVLGWFGFLVNNMSAVLLGLCGAITAGVFKEAFIDGILKLGVPDRQDLYVTMAGGLFGSIVMGSVAFKG